MIEALAPIEQSRPIRTSRPIDGAGADHRAGADLGARPDHRAGIDRHAAFQARGRMHECARPRRRSPRTATRAAAHPETARARPRRRRDRARARAEHANVRRQRARRSVRSSGRRRRRVAATVAPHISACRGRRDRRAGAVERRDAGDAPIEIGAGDAAPRRSARRSRRTVSPRADLKKKRLGHATAHRRRACETARIRTWSRRRSGTAAPGRRICFGERERIVEAQRPERRIPDQADADRRADMHGVVDGPVQSTGRRSAAELPSGRR